MPDAPAVVLETLSRPMSTCPNRRILRSRPTLAIAIAIATATFAPATAAFAPAPAATLTFAGRNWTVKAGSGLGPGPNVWSADCATVDDAGALHLRVAVVDGAWACGEVSLPSALGYGVYSWDVASDVTHMDPAVVLGLFTYEDDTHELDVEMSRWGDPGNANNADFAVQPSDVPANLHNYAIPAGVTAVRATYAWAPASVSFTLVSTAGAPFRAAWQRNGSAVPVARGRESVHMNAWLFRGRAPTTGVDIVVSNFSWAPMPPL